MSLKLENYKTLSKYYIQTIKELFAFSKEVNIIPLQYVFLYSLIEEYIEENKLLLIENGFIYILKNKDYIETFNIDNLDNNENLEVYSDIKNIIEQKNNKEIKIFFSILENAKQLDINEKKVIKEYLNMILLILDKLNNLL